MTVPLITYGQRRFYSLVSHYPTISVLWNWEERTLRTEAYYHALTVMSTGEIALARFFVGVWLNNNQGLDIIDIAVLPDKDRIMISNWLSSPFWP